MNYLLVPSIDISRAACSFFSSSSTCDVEGFALEVPTRARLAARAALRSLFCFFESCKNSWNYNTIMLWYIKAIRANEFNIFSLIQNKIYGNLTSDKAQKVVIYIKYLVQIWKSKSHYTYLYEKFGFCCWYCWVETEGFVCLRRR